MSVKENLLAERDKLLTWEQLAAFYEESQEQIIFKKCASREGYHQLVTELKLGENSAEVLKAHQNGFRSFFEANHGYANILDIYTYHNKEDDSYLVSYFFSHHHRWWLKTPISRLNFDMIPASLITKIVDNIPPALSE